MMLWMKIVEMLLKKVGASNACSDVVGVSGFEPEASWTRTKRDTKLRHTPKYLISIRVPAEKVKAFFA